MGTLTRSQKLGLLGLLVGVGVAAVVVPLVAVGGGGGDDRGNNLTQAEVLKQVRKELKDMAEQLRIHLNSSTTSSPPPTSLESAAKVSVESRRRKKRQAPNLPPPPPPQQAPTAAASAPLTTALPAAPFNATNVANNSAEAGSSSLASPAADTNASVTSTVATISTTISPLLLLVDGTSNVLEMLEKTDKQILEAANSTASSSPGEEAQLVGKIAQLRAKVGRIELHSPADKQLASDLLTRVLTAEQDVTRTLEAVQVKEVEVVAKRKQQAVASLTRMNSTLAKLLNNLSLKLNSPLNVEQQIPANGSVLVANASAGNISLADGSVTSSPTEGEQNSSIVSFSTLQTEELEAGKETLRGVADNPAQLSVETQTTLDSLEKSLDRLTAALPQLTVKDEEERGVGRVLLASLEGTKSETTRALASLVPDGQQGSNNVNNINPAVGLLPASNDTLAGGDQVGISAVSGTVPGAQINGGAAVDVTSSTAAAAAASSPSSAAAAATVTPSPAAPPPSSPQ